VAVAVSRRTLTADEETHPALMVAALQRMLLFNGAIESKKAGNQPAFYKDIVL
jgi:hypothetical protein